MEIFIKMGSVVTLAYLVLTAFTLFISTNQSLAQSKSGTLEVIIKGYPNKNGSITVGVFNNKEAFLKEAFQEANIKIGNESNVTLKFENLPYGNYAASVYHDENDNGELDTNFIGIPKEVYGFSNNAKGMFGPPPYKDCLFEVNGPLTRITIYLGKAGE